LVCAVPRTEPSVGTSIDVFRRFGFRQKSPDQRGADGWSRASTKSRKISEVLDDAANRGGADSRRYAPHRAEHALCQIEPVPVVKSVITRIVETVTAAPVTPSSTWTAIINSGSEMNVNSNARAVSMAKPGEQQRFATPQLQ
jgi:hypothetical protein